MKVRGTNWPRVQLIAGKEEVIEIISLSISYVEWISDT